MMESKKDQWEGPWRLRLICCGREEARLRFKTGDEADAFREAYTSGPGVAPNGYSAAPYEPGHRRAAIKEWAGLSPESAPEQKEE